MSAFSHWAMPICSEWLSPRTHRKLFGLIRVHTFAVAAYARSRARRKETTVAKQRGKLLSSKVVFTGTVFSVRHDEVSEPGGVVAGRDIVVHPGSVVVMPVFPDGKFS